MSLLLAHSCPGRVRRHVAIKERAELEIIFPRVSGYRRDLPSEKLEAAFTADSRLEITPADIGPTSVVMEGIVGAGVTITPQVLERLRPSEISFNLAKRLLYARFRDDEGFPKQHLFPHIQRLARRWLDEGDLVTKGVPIGAILYQDQLARAAEKIDIALTRGSEGRLLAVLDPYNPKGSTQVSRGRSFSYAIAITMLCNSNNDQVYPRDVAPPRLGEGALPRDSCGFSGRWDPAWRCLVAKCFNGNNCDEEKPRKTSKYA
jgi:hypothetical protein